MLGKFDIIIEKLESNSEILDFQFTKNQIPMYLAIRFILIQSLINKEFNLSNPHIKANRKSIYDALKYIYHTIKSNLFFAPQKNIYIFSSGIVNKLEEEKYINRLYNEFYQLFKGDTQIIESSVKFSYLFPKKEKVYFSDLIDIILFFSSKIIRSNHKDIEEIEKFIRYLKSTNLFNENYSTLDDIKKSLIKIVNKIDISLWIYKKFLKIKKIKLVIVEDAHYLGQLPLILAAKSLEIVTAEYQHGYVGSAHPAYNYHKNIHSKIKEFLPEYLLIHGEYWGNVIKTPSQIFPIGLIELIKKINDSAVVQEKLYRILFISGGTVYKQLNEFIENSFEILSNLGFQVILRPHPSESLAINSRYTNLLAKGIIIDTENLYESLQKAEIIVGMEVSTVLFEAVCFTKKVYLMDTAYTQFYEPNNPFIGFSNEKELIQAINENRTIEYDSNYFWETKWQENYKKFIEMTIGLKSGNNN